MIQPVPSIRVRTRNDEPMRAEGAYVLYWMIAARRTSWSFALQHAVALARELGKPLIVLEALGCGYAHASDRLHRFVVEGMACNSARVRRSGSAIYYPYVEPGPGAGRGMVETLASSACAVVTDEFPSFFLPRMVDRIAPRLPVRLDQVDSCGLLPLRAAPEAFTTAHAFRRFLHKNLLRHLECLPEEDPLGQAGLPLLEGLPEEVTARWPAADPGALLDAPSGFDSIPIDHGVEPVQLVGGSDEGEARLEGFLRNRLSSYCELRNAPDEEGTSGLSPWIHFGHVSVHAIVRAILEREDWTPERVGGAAAGKREGW